MERELNEFEWFYSLCVDSKHVQNLNWIEGELGDIFATMAFLDLQSKGH